MLLGLVSGEIPDSPRLTLAKTSTPNLLQKQLKMKIGDFAVVRWSKPSGDYIMNFTDQRKYRARKRSPEGTRGAHEAAGVPSG